MRGSLSYHCGALHHSDVLQNVAGRLLYYPELLNYGKNHRRPWGNHQQASYISWSEEHLFWRPSQFPGIPKKQWEGLIWGLGVTKPATENQVRTGHLGSFWNWVNSMQSPKPKNSYFWGLPQIGKPGSELKRNLLRKLQNLSCYKGVSKVILGVRMFKCISGVNVITDEESKECVINSFMWALG